MPLYLTESDVAALLDPGDAVEAIEACFRRMAAGEVEIAPRRRLRLPEGALADMAASDCGLGLAGGKLYAATAEGATFVVCLFDSETSELVAVIEADQLGASGPARRAASPRGISPRAGATYARRHRLRAPGRDAGRLHSRRRARRSSASSRTAGRRSGSPRSASATGAEPGESHRDAAAQDVVVTITSSRDPVLRGEWLAPGSARRRGGRERRESPRARQRRARARDASSAATGSSRRGSSRATSSSRSHAGVLDWLEVHELHEVVAGEIAGRQSDDDIVVFKSNGLAAWDVALGAEAVRRARERGVGTTL